MNRIVIDHLAICAEDLAAGVAHVEDILGVRMSPGGVHPQMGTHNRLLSLGQSSYLEVIAIDAGAPPLARARWFDLDRFSGPPRLTNWIARCDDLTAALVAAPAGMGNIMDLARGDLRWRMAVPDDGRLPFDGTFPGLIAWGGTAHPAARLPDQGARLELLEIYHPQADMLRDYLQKQMIAGNFSISNGAAPKLVAHIRTADGVKALC